MSTSPLWQDAITMPSLDPAPPAGPVDICIVGAGIAGLSVALCALEAGRSVLVLERDGIGAGETGRTSAHLSSALDDRFLDLAKWFGDDGARLAAESHAAAIDQIERWVNAYGIACGFQRVDGYLFSEDRESPKGLAREAEAARKAGLVATFSEAGAPGLGALGPAVRFPGQARFHPTRYLAGLAAAVRERGGILARAQVTAVESKTVTLANDTKIEARSIVVAANVPFHERVAMHTKQAAYRTYVVAAPVPKGSFPDVLLWDDGDPYHYVRIEPGSGDTDLLLVGGEDHKTGQPDPAVKPYAELLAWARSIVPAVGEPVYAWSGQVLEPVDGLGFIGHDPGGLEGVFVVTGDSGHGLTHGTLAGPLLTGLMQKGEHPWQRIYDPSRVHVVKDWLSENLNVGLQYADWFAAGGASKVEDIGRGRGAIVRHGLHRLAVYRDDTGCLFAHDATCPHLGASVRWNPRERSWDCPAHGSRFDPCDGRALNGPSQAGLPTVLLPSTG